MSMVTLLCSECWRLRCRRKREAEGKKASFAEEMRRIEAARGGKLSGKSLLYVDRWCDCTDMC